MISKLLVKPVMGLAAPPFGDYLKRLFTVAAFIYEVAFS
jgi:hypothetical protein